jgi:hypothetical protein
MKVGDHVKFIGDKEQYIVSYQPYLKRDGVISSMSTVGMVGVHWMPKTKRGRIEYGTHKPTELEIQFKLNLGGKMNCKICKSYAINMHLHGRVPGEHPDLCDVCYWREQVKILRGNVNGLASCNRARQSAENECRLLRGALEDLLFYAKAIAKRAGVSMNDPNTGAINHAESILKETSIGEAK